MPAGRISGHPRLLANLANAPEEDPARRAQRHRLQVGRAENLRVRIAKHRNASRRLAANIDVSWAVLPSAANLAVAEACEKCRSRPTRDERELFVSAEFERAFEREL